MSETVHRCDVLIVGLGPVGAVFAAQLAQTGRSVVAIETQRDVYPLPRAAHVDHEIMRIFQSLDLIPAITPYIRVAPNYEFRSVDGRALIRLEREGLIGAGGWPVGYNVYQPGIERAIRAKLDGLASLRTLYGTAFEALERHDEDGVVVAVRGDDGAAARIEARLVVGCDGAWSPVREACGIALDDYAFDEPWLVLDARVADESRFPVENLQLCDPARPTTFVHMGPGWLRWEFMLKPDEDPLAMRNPERIDQLLAPWRELGEIAVERTAVYRFHGLVAREWRRSRVLLAGDAAHQMPPFMGQGLCSGLRDAANLVWKIDAALASGDLTLLDSYQQERDPHVRYVIERAIEMGRLVCTLDPVLAARRDAEWLAAPRIQGPPVFPALYGMTLTGSAAAGQIFPQFVADDGERLDDALGDGAWLIQRGLQSAGAPGVRPIDPDRDLPPSLAQAVTHWLGETGVAAVLVRPDRYVFGTGEAASLLEAWRARIAPKRAAA